MAYTYLIGWSKHKKYYYGVRYAKNSNPLELFKSYFTSSKYVKEFIEVNGDPDIIQVRKIFIDSNKARLWEHKVLRRINAVIREDFLNKTNNKSICPEVSACNKGKKFSNQTKNKMKLFWKQKWKDEKWATKRKENLKEAHNKEEAKLNHGKASKLNWENKNIRHKMIENKKKNYAFISPEGLLIYVKGLKNLCEKHNLSISKMSEVHRESRKHHKGWTKKKAAEAAFSRKIWIYAVGCQETVLIGFRS